MQRYGKLFRILDVRFGIFYIGNVDVEIKQAKTPLWQKQTKEANSKKAKSCFKFRNKTVILRRESRSFLLQYFNQFSRGFEPGDPI